MLSENYNVLRTDLAMAGIRDEAFISGLKDRKVTTSQVNWMGQLPGADKRLFYMPVIYQKDGQLSLVGVSAAVVNGMARLEQQGASTDKLELALHDYYLQHYSIPTKEDLQADRKYGRAVLEEFSKLYAVQPDLHHAYWALYCYFEPPVHEAAIRDFKAHQAENVKFAFFPTEDRVFLSQMYSMLAHPDHPRPYFNRSLMDREPVWMQVDFHPTNVDDGPTRLDYFADYDLDQALRKLNVVECEEQTSRHKIGGILRAGVSASVTPVGSKPIDGVQLIADPKTDDVIAIDLSNKKVDMKTLLAQQHVIQRRGDVKRIAPVERVIKAPSVSKVKHSPR